MDVSRILEYIRGVTVKNLLSNTLMYFACVLASFATSTKEIPFECVDGIIHFKYQDNLYSIESREFEYVIDWSGDYTSRYKMGTGFITDGTFVFSGALNHSREIVFVYSIESKRMDVISNVVDYVKDELGNWAAIQAMPLYGQKTEESSIFFNGLEIGSLNCSYIKLVEIKGGCLKIELEN